jgi:hypothetical protein
MTDLIPLPGGSWRLWDTVPLRSAGFPVRLVERLGDPVLAGVADGAAEIRGRGKPSREASARYEKEFAEATVRLTRTLRNTAIDPRFREAVLWQNPELVPLCLDGIGTELTRNASARRREGVVALYLQRYATKNESIGFFGPVGWARWVAGVAESQVRPGPGLLRERNLYFESWAIDAVASVLSERAELQRGLIPRRNPALLYRAQDTCIVNERGIRVPLTRSQWDVLEICDGNRTIEEITDELGADFAETLEILREASQRKLVELTFAGPVESHPERRLRARLACVPDPRARAHALGLLEELADAKDAVAASAGDPGRLAGALEALRVTFERVSGQQAERNRGQTYGARMVVFEDCVRDVDVRLGADALKALGEPLSLLLDSGRWLAARIGRDYAVRLRTLFEQACASSSVDQIPLAKLLALATRDFYVVRRTPTAAAPAVAEFQRRWSAILATPTGVRRHTVAVGDIADVVRTEFASEDPPWSAGLVHAPDIMLAARSLDAIPDGDFRFVLGEMHLAFNTVESRAFVDQSPDRAKLLRMTEESSGPNRMVVVPPREWPSTTRTAPPSALPSPLFTYWAPGSSDVSDLPQVPIPVSALSVCARGADLVVHDLAGDRSWPLLEVIGDYLSLVTVNAFRLVPPRGKHSPRITVGRLVIARETWRIATRRCDWAHQLDERRRYLQMRAWVARHGLPQRVFCSVPVELKPIFVDFTSPTLTAALAAAIRRTERSAAEAEIVLSEMLPDAEECWLRDAEGERYTSEFRMVVTGRGAS